MIALRANLLATAALSCVCVAATSVTASANCVVGALSAVCNAASPNPFTTTIGSGRFTPDNYALTVGSGASLFSTNQNAISLHDHARIEILSGASVKTVTTHNDTNEGLYGRGNSAIELDEQGTVVIDKEAEVVSQGVGQNAAAIHVNGAGDTIINSGTIIGGPTSPIFLQELNKTAASAKDTIENFGTIVAEPDGTNGQYGGQIVGSAEPVGINFINGPNALAQGNLDLTNGNDNVTFFAGSRVTGDVNGGGGFNNFTLDGAAGTADTLAGALKNFQTLTKQGAGSWTLTGNVGDDGGTVPLAVTVAGGHLILTGENAAFNGSVAIGQQGTLQLGDGGGTGNLAGNIADNGTLALDRNNSFVLAGLVSGTGSLSQIGSGTSILTADDTYSGGTTISAGTLQLGNGGAAGSIIGNVSDNGTLAFDHSGSQVFAGTISGSGGISQISSGTTVLTADNSFTGVTDIAAGTVQLGDGGTTGSVIGNITDNGALLVDHANSVTLPGTISGRGSLEQAGTGTTILSADDGYTGGTRIDSGILQLGNGGTTGSIVGNVLDDGALSLDRSNTLSLAGTISGTGSLSQIGTGTTILTADNAYTGGTTIAAGTLQLGNGGTTGSILGNVADNGTLAFDRSDSAIFAGVVSGSGSLAQIGSGTTILTADNTNTGGTTISTGTLQLGNGGTTGSILGNVTDNGVLAFDRSDSSAFAGTISGAGSLAQIGSGTTILTADNAYTGGTTISAGTLQLGDGGATGSILGNVTDNGVLAFDRSDSSAFAGTISGTGSLAQIGSGTTILTADNAFTGGTTISAGTLQLGDGGTSGSIAGNVTDDGTLAFDRSDIVSFAGLITGSGGIDQLGSGTTILDQDESFTGGALISAGTLAVGDASHPGAALIGGGAINIEPGGTLGGYGSVTGAVNNAGTIAVADALPAFASGPTGRFTINGPLANSGLLQLASSGPIGNVLQVNGNYTGDSGRLRLTALLNAGGPLSNQFTDRLLVTGTAAGTTTIIVNASGAGASTLGPGLTPPNQRGISIVQIAGAANPNNFQLSGGYVTGGTPFAYRLFDFGPGSAYGAADPEQSLVGDGGATSDYRLQNSFVGNGSTIRPELPPQIPSYLSITEALFNAGFQDLDSLHRRLGEIRDDQASGLAPRVELFARAYGQRFDYSSNVSFQNYGFNSEQDYAATQFGANWFASDTGSGVLRVGLAGTLGRLWVTPEAADGPSKSELNTEEVSGTATWLARSGWYVDAILSGGLFDGRVTTEARGTTLGLSGTRIGGSVEAGYPVPLGHGYAIEPQLQLVYQHLDFAERTDVDGIDVDLGSPNQGVFRAGLRLTKTIAAEGSLITPYLRANLLQGIGEGETVHLSNLPFDTGRFGTAFQIGGGVTGTITRNLSAYGEAAWQHELGSVGFRGWSLNGGLRYVFGAPPLIGPLITPVMPAPPMARTYLIFFDWDRALLSDTARDVLAVAARNSSALAVTRIEVDGYADRTGSHRYNKRLSLRRAKAVAAELERDGVPQDEIGMQGYGDSHLAVQTGPGVRSARNRRVEIILK